MFNPADWPAEGVVVHLAGLLRAQRGGSNDIDVQVTLAWFAHDPYAVHATFSSGEERKPVVWLLGRELLAGGLHAPCGEGDVHVKPEPARNDAERFVLVLELDTPSGHAELELPGQALAELLDATYAEVPAGTESLFLDIDTALAVLLDEENWS